MIIIRGKKVYLILLAFLICIVLGWILIKENDNKVAIRGLVTEKNQEDKRGQILVEGKIEEDTEFDKASVSINTKTKIINQKSDEKLKLSDIKVGDKVEVIITGPVRESYPVQVDAKIIRIK
ncbi:DUF3221 domain-containing protein [Clostridium sp.]|uniref:DUF3221 domain-containing protein n=1 Tax=Clostridium sp. TaxID=1506 RepID=UPI0025BF4F0F|nr:DUF3221 domain-containing protein [Clostridium sp.]